jgi:signal peptidase I
MSDELDLQTREETGRDVAPEARDNASRREVAVKTSETRDEKKSEPAYKKSVAREYLESAVVTLVMALFGMTFIVQAVKVPTGSMKDTIWVQDHLLVNKFIFGPHERFDVPVLRWLVPSRPIRRGDIIVFKYPKGPEVNYVKRVIGLPGETIEIKGTQIFIDGQPLPEHIVYVRDPQMTSESAPLNRERDDGPVAGAQWTVYYSVEREEELGARDYEFGFSAECRGYGVNKSFSPFRLPKAGEPLRDEIKQDHDLQPVYDVDNDGLYDSDQYFCMGDNRDNSQDSRCWGTVPRASIVGHAMFVYWSIDKDANPKGSSNPISDIFTRTRWWRTGTLIK